MNRRALLKAIAVSPVAIPAMAVSSEPPVASTKPSTVNLSLEGNGFARHQVERLVNELQDAYRDGLFRGGISIDTY